MGKAFSSNKENQINRLSGQKPPATCQKTESIRLEPSTKV